MGIVRRTIRNIIIAAFLSFSLFPSAAIAHGGKKMESKYLYEIQDFKSAQSLPPQTSKIGGLFGGYRHISIFPVPHDNAIGSNDMGKGITIVSFPKGKISYDKYFRHVEDLAGRGKYLPPISSELIGFGQVRGFHLFDFKKKLHREYEIVFPVSQYIDNIAIADSRQRHFLFEIESQKENPKSSFDVDKILQLVDLSSEKQGLDKGIQKRTRHCLDNNERQSFSLQSFRKTIAGIEYESGTGPSPTGGCGKVL